MGGTSKPLHFHTNVSSQVTAEHFLFTGTKIGLAKSFYEVCFDAGSARERPHLVSSFWSGEHIIGAKVCRASRTSKLACK